MKTSTYQELHAACVAAHSQKIKICSGEFGLTDNLVGQNPCKVCPIGAYLLAHERTTFIDQGYYAAIAESLGDGDTSDWLSFVFGFDGLEPCMNAKNNDLKWTLAGMRLARQLEKEGIKDVA